MDHGPVPPHERTWRHPSELAAEEREAIRAERTSSTARFAALASGAAGVVMIGILVIAITPGRSTAPIAVSATTTPPTAGSVTPTPTVIAGVRNPDADATVGTAATAATAGRSRGSGGAEPAPEAAIATPIGDGRRALVTKATADRSDAGRLLVRVEPGRTTSGLVVEPWGGAYVIELDEPATAHAIGSRMPDSDDLVTVMTDPPVEVQLGSIPNLTVEEGTPVLDRAGELIGLCSHADGRTTLIGIGEPTDAGSADR